MVWLLFGGWGLLGSGLPGVDLVGGCSGRGFPAAGNRGWADALGGLPFTAPFRALGGLPFTAPFRALGGLPFTAPFRALGGLPFTAPFRALGGLPFTAPCPAPVAGLCLGGGAAGAAVVVLAADDVVLAEIGPVLDLDQDDRHAARVLDAVPGPARHVDGPPRLEPLRMARDDHARGTRDDDPVLGPEAVALQAEPLPGPDDEPLDLVATALLDGLEAAPGPGLEDADRGGAATGARSAHSRITRAKSASTLLLTSSSTSAGTSSSRSSTTMARPRRVRRPTCIEAMFTLCRPRMDPMRPTMPGRSS